MKLGNHYINLVQLILALVTGALFLLLNIIHYNLVFFQVGMKGYNMLYFCLVQGFVLLTAVVLLVLFSFGRLNKASVVVAVLALVTEIIVALTADSLNPTGDVRQIAALLPESLRNIVRNPLNAYLAQHTGGSGDILTLLHAILPELANEYGNAIAIGLLAITTVPGIGLYFMMGTTVLYGIVPFLMPAPSPAGAPRHIAPTNTHTQAKL